MILSKNLKKVGNFIINMLFPVNCIGCHKKDEIICSDCIQKLQLTNRETLKDIRAVFDYRDDVVRNIIWELKYHHKRYLGYKMGQLLYEFLIEEVSDLKISQAGKPIIVIPTPISNKRTKTRGYNQACSIAKGFCSKTENGILELKNNIIFKKVDNKPQAKITNRKRRLENVRGVFGIKNSEIVRGRTIIVIDDVTTTGGTISEIMKTLREAGAKKVVGFAIAH